MGIYNDLINQAVSFGRANPVTALIFAGVFLILLFRRPKLVFSLLVLALILVTLYSAIINTSISAKAEKEKLIEKSEQQPKDY